MMLVSSCLCNLILVSSDLCWIPPKLPSSMSRAHFYGLVDLRAADFVPWPFKEREREREQIKLVFN